MQDRLRREHRLQDFSRMQGMMAIYREKVRVKYKYAGMKRTIAFQALGGSTVPDTVQNCQEDFPDEAYSVKTFVEHLEAELFGTGRHLPPPHPNNFPTNNHKK